MISSEDLKALEQKVTKGTISATEARRLIVEVIVLRQEVWNWKEAIRALSDSADKTLTEALLEKEDLARDVGTLLKLIHSCYTKYTLAVAEECRTVLLEAGLL